MNPETIVLVQKSFKVVASIADEVGPMFYARLFDVRPELRPLFADNIEPQARKLVQMLAMVVNGLHRLDALMPAIEDLARRHIDYGVVAEHYPAVGDALIWTLEQGLGDAFTPPVRRAWVTTYAALSRAMIAATRETSGIH
ncbi:globin family protein [Sphingomonas psychrotolerans]|uniref:Hemin receptor n=1 Tax=Sphingomonas psychrotolerans TaxID=1327635 RepID=A0A2K8MLC5_9SPHN|nr:globin family protein [Sphingomonas psychrotolerans]ATY32559.1 hemin receptor [Sphingomonas psychrotolerans]